MSEQYCHHKNKDYTMKVGDDMQDVCEECSIELTNGTKRREKMAKKTVDAPPTLPATEKDNKKVKAPAKAEKPKAKVDPKAKFAEMKAKKNADKPAAKITFGVVQGGHYVFTKMNFDDPQTALDDVKKLCQPRLGKGLREVIITFRG